jgi:hypothetical protein
MANNRATMPHMALELNKLTTSVDALGTSAAKRLAELGERLPAAERVLQAIGAADAELRRKVDLAVIHRWGGAIPTGEAVDGVVPLPPHPDRLNVIAADGSQIYPDRHEVALYYLINVGSIVFRHGLPEAPRCSSLPQVFFEDADLYEEDGGLIPSVMIDAERDVRELGELARLAALEMVTAPTLTLVDNGLMLYISLQTNDQRLIDEMVGRYLDQLDAMKKTRALVAGIVERPRSQSVVRLLHLATLDFEEIRDPYLRELGAFQHINDGQLFQFLKPGQRSALFVYASPVNKDRYEPRGHAIYFFYLNAGRPGKDSLLRVEVPEWVAQDSARVDLVHAAVYEQCRVSDGFPYVLMRAHELAVVTVAERRELEQMVIGSLIRRGLMPSLSQKALGKQWTGSAKRRFPR